MHRFERLSRLKDYKVDKHQVDPRGWDIVNLEGRSIGEVKDLIVDTVTMKGIYLDAELDRKLFDMRGDPHLLIPLQRAERQGTHKRLLVAGLDAARVQEICTERERQYYEFWDGFWQRQVSGDDLRRAIETARPGEQVRIPVMNEEIIVERRPLASEERPLAEPHLK